MNIRHFIETLQLIFIVFKLVHVIDWSWLWVLSPILMILGFYILVVITCIIWLLIDEWIEKRSEDDKNRRS